MLRSDDAPELMRRLNKRDFDHDIVYGSGYNVQGTTRYIDRDLARAIYQPAYAEQIVGKAINTGLSPDDTLECLLWHEAVEKVLLDARNPVHFYREAHEFASAAEDELVWAKGGKPYRYWRGLELIFDYCASKPLKRVPADYACTPLLDDPEPNARRVLQVLRSAGIPDALKLSKEAVNYGLGFEDHCAICVHWQAANEGVTLSACDIVDGLVRQNSWCVRFESNASDASSIARVPLKLVGGTFVVPVEINGAITLDFVVDSGAADVSVPADVAGTLMRTKTLKSSDFIGSATYILADGSKSPSDTFIIRSLKIGDKTIENIRGSIAPVTASPLLGQSFFQHFKSWSIDNSKRELLLEM